MLETIRRWLRGSRREAPPRVVTPPSVIQPPSREQLDAISGNTQLVRKTMADLSGTDYPPGRAGVQYLDGCIDRTRPGLDDAAKERMGTICGCYLGEALVVEYGGARVQSSDGLGVQFSAGNVAYPINKATKHWQKGVGDSVLSFFDIAGVLWADKKGPGEG